MAVSDELMIIGCPNCGQKNRLSRRGIKKSHDVFRILFSSGKAESDYLILEFVKKFVFGRDRVVIFLATDAMEFYLKIQDLLRDKLCERPKTQRLS